MSPVVPETRRGFDLGDYVEVKDRIRVLYELYPQARIVTEPPILTNEPDGKPRVVCRALVYRSPDDPHPSPGTSWLELPGTTPYTRGSEVENAETSAVGRAIGFLGILIDRSIASRNEIDAKAAGEAPRTAQEPRSAAEPLIGMATQEKKVTTDFEVRQSPDGSFVGFRLKDGRGAGVICEVVGPMADALKLLEPSFLGQRVEVWGSFRQYEPPVVQHPYRAFRVTKIRTPEWTLPADATVPSGPADVASSEPTGTTPAPSLFASQEAELDGLVA